MSTGDFYVIVMMVAGATVLLVKGLIIYLAAKFLYRTFIKG